MSGFVSFVSLRSYYVLKVDKGIDVVCVYMYIIYIYIILLYYYYYYYYAPILHLHANTAVQSNSYVVP